MRVWVIGRALPQKNNLNLGSFEFDQAKALADNGLDVFYPEVNSGKGFFFYKVTKRIIDKVIVLSIQVPLFRIFSPNIQIKFYRRTLIIFLRFMSSHTGEPDVIHVHYPSIYPYGVFKHYQEQGVRIVATEHWSKVLDGTLQKKLRNNLVNFVKNSDSFICVSGLLKDAVIRITGTKRNLKVIPNMLSDSFVNIYSPKEQHQGFYFIAVSRLTAIKRFDLLIQAFDQAFSGQDDIKLSIVGDGEESRNLQNLIYSLGCQNKVKLLGYVEPCELKKFYMKSDTLIVISSVETFSVPVIEAMSCGLPVVVTKNVGVADYVNSKNGIVIESDDVNTVSEAMKYMVAHKDVFDSDEIIKVASENFNKNSLTTLLLREYGLNV